MKRIYTMGGDPAVRQLTVADILAMKGQRKLVQATATTVEEASAAAEAGLDMLSVSVGDELRMVRAAAPTIFLNAALPLTCFASQQDLLRAAYEAMEDGADAVYFCGPVRWVEYLSAAAIPVMGHAGLVPRKSIWLGGLRAFGKTPVEARRLWQDVRDLENAGAYAVEIEVVPAELTAEITKATSLSVSSIGSGPHADIVFQFTEDTLGTTVNAPRHVKAYEDFVARLADLQTARVSALKCFAEEARSGAYPGPEVSVATPQEALEALRTAIHGGKQ
ncbi:3-methyl-2-oxobutanoate hydroxymethyltransferase [Ruegeria sp. R13_0]|uniref:3-methyl-2-oxobutanoate hydroxymethyltransferase n=1 Tax=Ruegeria sp. R13_0 TaxID=2821099 RepID=UPI001AD9935D|nr:3-methyl-2-oxobutanoate hydroxymethyltransferase [Ruegeria sp. R13_0]MBO9433349.1 3-methyl-2-oxobutanoate hydroxymethyltransferase [Ruegeria sp. R13_0]